MKRFGLKKRSTGGFEKENIMEFFEGCNALSKYNSIGVRSSLNFIDRYFLLLKHFVWDVLLLFVFSL